MKVIIIIAAVFFLALFFAIFPSMYTVSTTLSNTTIHSVTNNLTSTYYMASNSTQVYAAPELQDMLGSNLFLIGVLILLSALAMEVYNIFKGGE